MKLRHLLPALLLSLGTTLACTKKEAAAPATAPALNAEAQGFNAYTNLVWHDEFDGTALDTTKWAYEVQDDWYNNELQATTDRAANLTVNSGVLHLIARRENYHGKRYTSARIVTQHKYNFGFGRFDVYARLPQGKGFWPAIWMLGADEKAGGWPAGGEIDLMEVKGSDPTTTYSTLHFSNKANEDHESEVAYPLPGASATHNLATDYHLYSVVRSRDQVRCYLDGVLYKSFSPADSQPFSFDVFNAPFYAILNVAVGGDYDGDPDGTTVFPQAMQVDYVRFYQHP